MSLSQLNTIFHPATIAVIGANDRQNSVGYSIFKNIKNSAWKGTVFPVNSHSQIVQGTKAYDSISSIAQPVDLAIIATPAPTVLEIVSECVKAKVAGICIISSGFKEAGIEGQKMFAKIQAIVQKSGVKILGPNCLGFINPSIGLNASFAPAIPQTGGIAFISQSGALCNTFLDWAIGDQIGFSYFISIGSMADISFDELIDYLDTDPNVTSILLYMESINNARRFMSSARAFSKTKPIIALKAGIGDIGAKAVASHTGTIAGDNKVFSAAFKRAGVIRAGNISELFNYAKTLNHRQLPKGNRLAIITNAGGPAVIATDFLTSHNGKLAQLADASISDLNKILPPAWSKSNPIDLLGDAQPSHYQAALKTCLNDPNIDGIIIILTPQAVTDALNTAQAIVSLPEINDKPIFASFMGNKRVKDGIKILLKAGIPVYRTPEKAIKCFIGINEWKQNLELIGQTPGMIPSQFTPDTETASKIINRSIKNKQFTLVGIAARKFLECYNLPVNPVYLVKNTDQIATIAKQTGFPMVMKLEAAGLLHKTELGGVRIGIKSIQEAKDAFKKILSLAQKSLKSSTIEGITIEKSISKKFELIIGAKKDSIFGPVIAFGMGGVAVEVYNDVTIGLPPLNMALSKYLMEQTKIYTLLKGYRNMKGADLKSIQFFLYKFSYLLADFPQIKEIDINPLSADENGVLIIDAKIVIDPQMLRYPHKPYSHLAIMPYIREYESNIKLSDNTKIFLRPIMAEDEPRHRQFLDNLSPETKRFRFFGIVDIPDSKFVKQFAQIDYDREIAIIAEIENKGIKTTIGVARLIENVLDNNAEFAIVIADAWQKKGLGKKLTEHIIRIARSRNFKKIYLDIAKDNHAMKSLAKSTGFTIKETPDSYFAELKL